MVMINMTKNHLEKLHNIDPKKQGERLCRLIKQTFLSRRAFARKYAFSTSSLQNWEEGRYQKGIPRVALAQLISAFLSEGIHCEREWLLYGEGSEPYKIQRRTDQYAENKDSLKSEKDILKLTIENAERHRINRQLYAATVAGRFEEAVHLIQEAGSLLPKMSGIRIHLYDNHEDTLLHVAAREGHLPIVEFLIKNGTKVDVRNRRKQTSLHLAAHNGHNKIIDYLLTNGANIEAVEDEGGTPLSWASYVGQLGVVKQLVSHGANVHSADIHSNTPLHWACYHGHIQVVKFLVSHGADLKKKNSEDYLPLDFAIENGHVDTVIFLTNEKI